MQNSEVMMRGHGAFRDFKLIQKNTKKARRGDKEKTCGGGDGGGGVWLGCVVHHSECLFFILLQDFFHILPFSSIV